MYSDFNEISHTYTLLPGMVYKEGKCVECPAGSYHVTSGSILDSSYTSQCLQCPSGTISQPGSSVLSSCFSQVDVFNSR